MKQLLLLRHAKSSWDTSGLSDHERPLALRGSRATAALHRHFAGAAIAPDLVLCSTARRAMETWEGIASGCPPATRVEYLAELYGATAGDLLRRLREVPDDIRCVLLIGHNPGLGELAARLVGHGDTELRHRLETKFPTGALTTLALSAQWAELRWGATELTGYVVPRDLPTAATGSRGGDARP